MLKEIHPEYDPHEPMITSAFSEEDLRKSREDVYEDTYKNDIDDFGSTDFDPAKTFSINTNVNLDIPKPIGKKQERISGKEFLIGFFLNSLGRQCFSNPIIVFFSEAESDQEPSSTVDNSSAIVWNGCINMVDVARFYVAAHEVSVRNL